MENLTLFPLYQTTCFFIPLVAPCTPLLAKQDYILTPGRYVGIEEQEDDGEPFEEKMGRLTSELSELFAKSHELEAQIKERLGAIGYDI